MIPVANQRHDVLEVQEIHANLLTSTLFVDVDLEITIVLHALEVRLGGGNQAVQTET